MSNEIAALQVKAEADGVSQTADALDKLTDSAEKADKAVKPLGPAAEKAGRDVDKLGKASVTAEGALAGMARMAIRAGAVLAGAFSVRAYIQLGDAWSDMQSKVGAAVKDMQAAPALMQRMVDLANASYSPLNQTVDVYARNVGVLRDLGISAQGAADYTEALNHALVITATKGQQAAGVQNALSKAMAVGRLQADGLETVMANGGRVAEALAEKLGTNVNGLRDMASQGKITSAVIAGALLESLEKLREEAGEMPATVADGMERIRTGIQALIGVFDQAVGATGALAGVLVSLGDALAYAATWAAENADLLQNLFVSVIGTGIAAVTLALSQYVIGLGLAAAATVKTAIATGTLSGALGVLKSALVSTGIGAVVVLAGILIGQFMKLVSATGSVGEAFNLLADVAREAFSRIGMAFDLVVHAISVGTNSMAAFFIGKLKDMIFAFMEFTWGVAEGLNELFGTNLSGAKLGGVAAGLVELENGFKDAAATAKASMAETAEAITAPMESIAALRDAVARGEAASGAGVVGTDTTTTTTPSGRGGGGGGLNDQYAANLQALIESLQTEQATIDAWYQSSMEILNDRRALEILGIEEHNALKEAIEAEHQNRLHELMYRAQSETLGHYGTLFGNMARIAEAGGDKLLGIAKAFSIAEGLINSYRAYTQVLADPSLIGRPFLRTALAASTLASGLAQVANMRGVSKGGGGGGAGSAAATQAAAPAPQTISIQGVDPRGLYTGQAIIDLTDAVQGELKNRGMVIQYV